MNFLGHLYFSNNNSELMYSNLFGDFVKGKDLTEFSPIVRSGIQLHRSIDSYIDHHPEVVKLMHALYSELPKVTGIAIDLFFDYCLAKNWSKYHDIPLKKFLEQFYSYQPHFWKEYNKEFQELIHQMRIHRWLNHYPTFYGLQKACEGVSKRLSFENTLIHAPEIYLKHEEIINRCFSDYMLDAKPYFQQKINSLVI